MIIGTNVLIMTVFHPETTGNHAQLDKAKTFIEMSRVNIAGNNSIKLQDAEAMEFSLNKTVGDQFLSDMKSPCLGADCIAGIADMTAPADIVGMKNVKSQHIPSVRILCYSSVCLLSKKCFAGFRIQKIFLGESNAVLHDLVPDLIHSRKICGLIGSDDNIHDGIPPNCR